MTAKYLSKLEPRHLTPQMQADPLGTVGAAAATLSKQGTGLRGSPYGSYSPRASQSVPVPVNELDLMLAEWT